jgi:hypothetical protein
VPVGVGVQLLGDLIGQHVDLGDQRLQGRDQSAGHVHRRCAGVAGGSGCGPRVGQLGGDMPPPVGS